MIQSKKVAQTTQPAWIIVIINSRYIHISSRFLLIKNQRLVSWCKHLIQRDMQDLSALIENIFIPPNSTNGNNRIYFLAWYSNTHSEFCNANQSTLVRPSAYDTSVRWGKFVICGPQVAPDLLFSLLSPVMCNVQGQSPWWMWISNSPDLLDKWGK